MHAEERGEGRGEVGAAKDRKNGVNENERKAVVKTKTQAKRWREKQKQKRRILEMQHTMSQVFFLGGGRGGMFCSHLVEVLLPEVGDGFVDLQVVGQLHILRALHHLHTPEQGHERFAVELDAIVIMQSKKQKKITLKEKWLIILLLPKT